MDKDFIDSLKSDDTLMNIDTLYRSGKLCAQGVRWKASTQKYLYDNLLFAFQAKQKIIQRRKVHDGFVIFTINERGKEREAYSIHIRERVIQRVLSDEILMPYTKRTIVDRNCASIKGKGEKYAENALKEDLYSFFLKYKTNRGYVVKWDASKYFDHIEQDKMKREYYVIPDEIVRWLVTQFADAYKNCEKYKDGIGMGLGTQFVQLSGIIALNKFDHFIKEKVEDGKFSTRYMDDTYLLTTKEHKGEKLELGIEKLKQEGFDANRDKCRIYRIDRGFIWLKKVYRLTDTGKVLVYLGQKTITRERHAILDRRKWVNNGKTTYFSYENQARSWLINIRKYYNSLSKCEEIERTFQWCFYRLLEDNENLFIKRLNKLIKALENENVILFIKVCTLYMVFNEDVNVLSNVLGRTKKYISEDRFKKTKNILDNEDVSYVVAKCNEKDNIDISLSLKELNSYDYFNKK